MNGLNMKAFIVTDKHLIDVNDNVLDVGKYYFLIKNFSSDNTVIGDIIDNSIENTQYEFRFFTLMTMMVKGQSYLARRVERESLSNTLQLKGDHMPNYSSPRKYSNKKIMKTECIICLNELINYESENKIKKLNCGHRFHEECIGEWMENNTSCPFCREEII